MQEHFHELQGELLHLFNDPVSRDRMGCLKSIFQIWQDINFVQGEKNTGSKGHEGSFQVKQHPTGFIGSADDIIFTTEPGV